MSPPPLPLPLPQMSDDYGFITSARYDANNWRQTDESRSCTRTRSQI